MTWRSVAYALACVFVPVVWGVGVVWISNRIELRLLGGGDEEKRRKAPPIEYHI
jgi:hypothetical protein